jgi:hypothetical protein
LEVRVTNLTNGSSNLFTLPTPLISHYPQIITDVSNIPVGNYSEISISGSNFISGDTVSFNGLDIPSDRVFVNNSTSITVTMSSSENYSITSAKVRWSESVFSNLFTLPTPLISNYPPIITDVSNIPVGNYSEISISGSNFVSGDTVSFNGSNIPSGQVEVNNSTSITVTMISSSNYSITAVRVTNSTNVPSTLFTLPTPLLSYFPPTITSASVTTNEVSTVTLSIRGTCFLPGVTASVTVNGSSVTTDSVSVYNATVIQVTLSTILQPTDSITVKITDAISQDSNSYPFTFTGEILSDICFIAGTPITTDQGNIPIEKIDPSIHTIRNKKIVAITKTVTQDKYLVCFEKDALGKNIPSQQTIISKNHKLFYNGKMGKACEFLKNFDNVTKVKYTGAILYNVLLEEHDKMMVNNLICETLHPENGVAKVYMALQKLDTEGQQSLIKKINAHVIKNNVFNTNKK